jgi:formylglycine-generating enzyme required for sulfatase activity
MTATRGRRGLKAAAEGIVWIPSQSCLIGSDRHYAEEGPAHLVDVDGFWMETHAVTNARFAEFVNATGYLTVAERPIEAKDSPGAPVGNRQPGSMVFTGTHGPVDLRHLSQWWRWTPGACWRRPDGPGSSIEGRGHHPVVHVAYEDATAYAAWAGRLLPTEAQWEVAARGGLNGSTYVWGDEPEAGGQRLANYWHGDFPWHPAPGYGSTAPVGSYPANGYGLYDMAGNVWEWTTDWYSARHLADDAHGCCVPRNPRGTSESRSVDPAQPQLAVPRKVIKGGSFLCSDSYCLRYRPAARRPQMIDTGMSHIGFRCIAHLPWPAHPKGAGQG